MQPPRYLGPVAAPHKTPQFRLLVALLITALLCAPFISPAIFAGFPAIPFDRWSRSAAMTLAMMLPLVWLAFRFGLFVWFLIGLGFLVLGLSLRAHS